MPTFNFTSPEGQSYTVKGPQGATQEQAFGILQTQIAQGVSRADIDPNIPSVEVRGRRASDQIPNEFSTPEQLRAQALAATPSTPADPSLVDRVLGAGETLLTLGTGATTGALGMLAGGAAGALGNLTSGRFGMKDGVEAGMQQGAESLTYAPRTPLGQEYAQTAGNILHETLPAIPLTAEMAGIGRGVGAVSQGARDLAPIVADVGAGVAKTGATAAKAATQAGVERIRAASPAIADRVERTLRRNPEKTPTPGTKGSAGAAANDIANQRRDIAEGMPVPIDLTEGQAIRDPLQLKFEMETAKGEYGAKLRERAAQQNEDVYKNFDAFVDMTGAEQSSLRGIGKTVDEALMKKVSRDKAEIRTAYNRAEKAGELEAPVTLESVIQHLNDSAPEATTAPLLKTAKNAAIKLGIAAEDASGELVALPTTLKNAEQFRKTINRATNLEPTNIRQAAIIKGAVDAQTDGIGGGLYRAARRTRENFANQYENRAVISDLIKSKRGSNDRKVAFEDVLDHTVLKGDLDDVRHVRRVLQTAGDEGRQAYRELQGGVANWIKEQASSNNATDMRGNVIISAPKLEKAIRQLDQDGRLEFLFGKQGAEKYRDMVDLTKSLYTQPPGFVNHSNTASTILAALGETGANFGLFGLPVPVLTGIKFAAKQLQNKKLQKRIDAALAKRRDAPKKPQPAPPLPPNPPAP